MSILYDRERDAFMNFAVALAGGGVRGAYQIGALRALTEMGIRISAVCGTSIGAINGAVFAQGDMEKAEELWQNIHIRKIIALSGYEAETGAPPKISKDRAKSFLSFSKSILDHKGIDVTPLKKLLLEVVNEEKLRASAMDFGLTTFSLTDRTPVEVFKPDIPAGKMVDYLLASACFPGFKRAEIDGKDFIDGGVANKVPVSMLIDKGYKNIIAVDVGGPGYIKTVDSTGINLFTIKNPEKSVGMFEFDQNKINRSIHLGYLDTHKAFGKLQGRRYYFNNIEYAILRSRYSKSIIAGLEYCAELLDMENARSYEAREFIDTILEQYKRATERYHGLTESLLAIKPADLLKNWKKEEKLKHGVILPLLATLDERGAVTGRMLKRLAAKEFLAAGSLRYLSSNPDIQ